MVHPPALHMIKHMRPDLLCCGEENSSVNLLTTQDASVPRSLGKKRHPPALAGTSKPELQRKGFCLNGEGRSFGILLFAPLERMPHHSNV